MSHNIHNPVVPYIGPITGPLSPGRTITIRGNIFPNCNRFAVNLQNGPNVYPRDDVTFHFGVDFVRGCVVRNNIQNMNWGPEETEGGFPFVRGSLFDIAICCEPMHYRPNNNSFGGVLNKAGAAVAGLAAAAGLKSAMGHGHGQTGQKSNSYLGPALGAGLAGAALTGHLSPKKMLKSNKKARKRALKYGLPLAGAGLGAYALHKTFHHSSSSSSSSSSSGEE